MATYRKIREAAAAASLAAAAHSWSPPAREWWQGRDIKPTTPAGRLRALAAMLRDAREWGMDTVEFSSDAAQMLLYPVLTASTPDGQHALSWLNVYGALYADGETCSTGENFDLVSSLRERERVAYMSNADRVAHEWNAGEYGADHSPLVGVAPGELPANDWRPVAAFWLAVLSEQPMRFIAERPNKHDSLLEQTWRATLGGAQCEHDASRYTVSTCQYPGTPVYGFRPRSTVHLPSLRCQRHTGSVAIPADRPGQRWRAEALSSIRFADGRTMYYRDPQAAGVSFVECPRCAARSEVIGDPEAVIPPCYGCGHTIPGGRVQNYTTQAPATLFKARNEKRCTTFFGIELEMEYAGCADPQRVLNAVARPQLFIFKTDTSLARGVEMVTSPMSYAKWCEDRDVWTTRLEKFAKSGFRSYDTTTCGMHIHVSRSAFTPSTAYVLQSLVYENPSFIQTLAQRPGNRYTTYDGADAADRHVRLRKARICRPGDQRAIYGERHQAINFPNNKPTVEVRIFRGTLNAASFFKNLEVVASLVAFVNSAGLVRARSAEAYLHFALDHKAEYPYLYEFLRRKQAAVELSLRGVVSTADVYARHLPRPNLPMKPVPVAHAAKRRVIAFSEANC